MTFDWTTFVLEAINFLILVWLLKRFLYRPVLDIIARRQAAVNQTLAAAESARAEAARLQAEYESRQGDWERERERLRRALDDELDAVRDKRLAALAGEIESERKRSESVRERERAVEQRELQERALQQANTFAARLLARVAGSELDVRIADMLLSDLQAMPPARRAAVADALAHAASVNVWSARPLAAALQQRIEAVLAELAGHELKPAYSLDPALLAGLRVRVGAWELAADLAGELDAFAELSGHG